MRKFLIFPALCLSVLLPLSALAFTIPARPAGFVNDYAGMLTSDQVSQLEAKVRAFEKSTTDEIAVVTIPSLDGDVIENVAQDIFTKWSIGKKDTNNGVLLLVSLADKKTRIQTGYGVEGALTDIGTSFIQSDVITPAFKAGDYYGGINGALDKMIEALNGSDIVPSNYHTGTSVSKLPWQGILFFVFIFFQILAAILGRSKSWWGGGVLGGVVALIIWHFFISSILLAIPLIIFFIGGGLLFDFIVSRAYAQKQATGRFPMWWFWGGGGGMGGGGFGGFGGGGSGGGGSSGGW